MLPSSRPRLLGSAAADDCETKLRAIADEKGIAISGLPFDDFKPFSIKELGPFIHVRTETDVSRPQMKLRKGKAEEAAAGVDCLILRARQLGDQPVIGLIPEFPTPELPRAMAPMETTKIAMSSLCIEDFEPTVEWVNNAYNAIKSLKDNVPKGSWTTNLVALKTQSHMLAKKIKARLPLFLKTRLPEDNLGLHPGQHWVWEAFVSHLTRIACLIVMSDLQAPGLETRKDSECLLADPQENFKVVEGSEYVHCDGCYLHVDWNRRAFRRAGQTVIGFAKRNGQHERASHLNEDKTMNRAFYRTYPHQSARERCPCADGTFEDLKQVVGIGMERIKMTAIANLFVWGDKELQELDKLKWSTSEPGSPQSKKYKQICYLTETAFAVAIAPEWNITQNPTCEWQLKYYGK